MLTLRSWRSSVPNQHPGSLSLSIAASLLFQFPLLLVKTSVLALAPIEIPAGVGKIQDLGHMRAKLS